MSYIKSVTKAGSVTDVVVYHDPKHNSPKRPRSKNRSKTTETQKKHNDRRSKKTLFYLISANYKADDLYLTLTYRGKEPPPPENAKERIGKFLRDLRRIYHKYGIPLKYIITTEASRVHHHLLINNIGIGIAKIKKLWDAGFSKIQLFGGEKEDSERLANYMDKAEKKHRKRNWSCSQNLIHPKPVKTVVPASTWREPIKPPKGYYLDKDSVQRGETALSYPYLSYRLIKLPPLPGEDDST